MWPISHSWLYFFGHEAAGFYLKAGHVKHSRNKPTYILIQWESTGSSAFCQLFHHSAAALGSQGFHGGRHCQAPAGPHRCCSHLSTAAPATSVCVHSAEATPPSLFHQLGSSLFSPAITSVGQRKVWAAGCDSWQLGLAEVSEGGMQHNTQAKVSAESE